MTKFKENVNVMKKDFREKGDILGIKICILLLAVFPLAISATYCALFWKMWTEALELKDSMAATTWDFKDSDVSYYDSCGGSDFDTKWSVILAFNSILYLCATIFTCCFCVGIFAWPCSACACIGHTLAALA